MGLFESMIALLVLKWLAKYITSDGMLSHLFDAHIEALSV